MSATAKANAGNPAAKARWGELLDSPRQAVRWDWFALLRLAQAAECEFPEIGRSAHLREDHLRLGQPPFFHPPPNTIASLKLAGPQEDGAMAPAPRLKSGSPVAWLQAYHFGLFGPRGPLPPHLTEYAYDRLRSGDAAFAAFCDVLHHRFASFFFRAWAGGRPEVSLDRRDARGEGAPEAGNPTQWEFYLGCLAGVGLDALREADSIPSEAKLYYAGWLLQPTRSLEGLQAILRDYFEVPVRVLPFFPRKLRLPESARWRLGADALTGRLGCSALVGEEIKDYQAGFRIRVGPLKLAQLRDLLPETEGFRQLHDWVRLYLGAGSDHNAEAGLESAWDLLLVLDRREVPKCKLGDSVKFSVDDILGLPELVNGLLDEQPVTRFLRLAMGAGMTDVLMRYKPGAADAERLAATLVRELNQLIAGPLLSKRVAFEKVKLRAETEDLRKRIPTGKGLVLLNRKLLEDALPTGLAKYAPGEPARLGWTTWLHSHKPSRDLEDLLVRPGVKSATPGGLATERGGSAA